MNYDEIAEHLRNYGHDAWRTKDGKSLIVKAKIGHRNVTLVHKFPDLLLGLPQFRLAQCSSYPSFAHVFPLKTDDLGWICVHDSDAISINFEVPTAAYKESLDSHLELLERVITDPVWNREELLREFRTNWDRFCSGANDTNLRIYLASDIDSSSSLQIKGPVQTKSGGILSHSVGLGRSESNDPELSVLRNILNWDTRPARGKALILHLTALDPAPTRAQDLVAWYLCCIKNLQADSTNELTRLRQHPSKEFWLVFTIETKYGRIWFAIQLTCKNKAKEKVPISEGACENWKIRAVSVRSLNPEAVVSRGGGELSFAEKSVLLVGCGSVGSELAYRLASIGLGKLQLSDPDSFYEDNLYRHTLTLEDVGYCKSARLAKNLRKKFPWMSVSHDLNKLENFKNIEDLNCFDLIVVAIGAPTIERYFQLFVSLHDMTSSVMNVWIEAQGIGGHATLAIPDSKGCLLCAYVDPLEFTRGLSSNMNFLAPNQAFLNSQGGCADLFLPYSGISSTQTATMAADLATRFLTGEIQTSSKVSWKGNSHHALIQGFETTFRYEKFKENLEILPLYHSECDRCGG